MSDKPVVVSDRPAVFYDTDLGRWVYRMSAIGSCEQALLAARSGLEPAPPPPSMQAIFDTGTDLESKVLKHAGIKIADPQAQVELDAGKPLLRGHIDGYAHYALAVVEVKTVGDDNWARFNKAGIGADTPLFEKWRWQVSCYMYATDRSALFVVGLKTAKGKTIGDTATQTLTDPPVAKATILEKIRRVEESAEQGKAPECEGIEYPCPYYFLHTVRDVPVVDDDKLARMLTDYDEERRRERIAGEVRKQQAEAIGAYLADHGWDDETTRRCGDWTVTWRRRDTKEYTVKARTSWYPDVKRRG